MTSPLHALLQELESAREKASPGPWQAFENGAWGGQGFGICPDRKDLTKTLVQLPIKNTNAFNNSDECACNPLFIQLAANKILLLTQIIKMQDEALARWEMFWMNHGCEEYSKPCPICHTEDILRARDTRNKINELITKGE